MPPLAAHERSAAPGMASLHRSAFEQHLRLAAGLGDAQQQVLGRDVSSPSLRASASARSIDAFARIERYRTAPGCGRRLPTPRRARPGTRVGRHRAAATSRRGDPIVGLDEGAWRCRHRGWGLETLSGPLGRDDGPLGLLGDRQLHRRSVLSVRGGRAGRSGRGTAWRRSWPPGSDRWAGGPWP